MARIILRVLFLLSVSFNAAFVIHLIAAPGKPAENKENKGELKLSEYQRKMMAPVRLEMHRENESVKREIAKCQEKLLVALQADPVDRGEVYRCIERIGGLQKKIQQNTVEEIIRLREYLDEDQCRCLIRELRDHLKRDLQPCKESCCNPPQK